jgi:hypothetical protein
MSLATLKKKTQSKYRNSSVGLQQFSLNGTRRLQGYIGQTSLSRALPRTPAGGAYAKGHGGCCGTHPSDAAITSAVTNTNDSSVVKSSVLSSKGMLAKRLRCCDSVVKPDNQTSLNSSSSYLEYLKNKCSQIETYSEYYVDDLWTFVDMYNNAVEQKIKGEEEYTYTLQSSNIPLLNGVYRIHEDGYNDLLTPIGLFDPNTYYVFKSYSEITFPFYLKCTEMTFDFETEPPTDRIGTNGANDHRETSDSVNIYKVYGIKNGLKTLIIDGTNTIEKNGNYYYTNPLTIPSDQYFEGVRIEFGDTHNWKGANFASNRIRIQTWKISGYVTDYKYYFGHCEGTSNNFCSSTHKDVIVASSQSDYLSRLKGKCLESTPEFQRVTNTCTSGRGACG